MRRNHANLFQADPAAVAARRQAVLQQCCESEQAWQQQPGRSLLLFFDGTGNILGNNQDTNVVKLFRAVDKSSAARQIAYYDPGVGTGNDFPAVDPVGRLTRGVTRLTGLALGHGVFDDIAEGYRFLAENYQDGDRICCFGFSRGAFTARAVAGVVNMYGLVHAAGLAILPSLVRSYFSPPGSSTPAGKLREAFAGDVVRHFSLDRTPLLHFVGVWDTVESVGIDLFGYGPRISNNPTVADKRFVHVRHALALHETRQKYAPRQYKAPGYNPEEQLHRSFDERWFRGNHSDIGGSYAGDGLSGITLKWMLDEAQACGMRFTPVVLGAPNVLQPLHDQTVMSPFWAWTGLNTRRREAAARADPSAEPLGAATPAPPMRQAAPKSAWLGGLLALAAAGLGWQAWAHATVACMRGGADFSLLGAQLLAPWLTALGISCKSGAVASALAWDNWFLLVYALFLAYPLAWAVRHAAPAAIVAGRPLGALARSMPWLMVGLVVADALENGLSRGLGGGESMSLHLIGGDGVGSTLLVWLPLFALSLCSAIKFVCLGLLLKVVVKPG